MFTLRLLKETFESINELVSNLFLIMHIYCKEIRAVASLLLFCGKDKIISSILPDFSLVSLIFLKFLSFPPHLVFRAHSERPSLRHWIKEGGKSNVTQSHLLFLFLCFWSKKARQDKKRDRTFLLAKTWPMWLCEKSIIDYSCVS